jgi:hypothetical protein
MRLYVLGASTRGLLTNKLGNYAAVLAAAKSTRWEAAVQAALLLSILAHKVSVSFRNFRPDPLGSYSRMVKVSDRALPPSSHTRTHTHARARIHALTHTRARALSHVHTHAHPRTHTSVHAPASAQMHRQMLMCADRLRQAALVGVGVGVGVGVAVTVGLPFRKLTARKAALGSQNVI